MTDQVQLSPTDWVREQTEQTWNRALPTGLSPGSPRHLFTVTGAKSGQKRYVPSMPVEKDGR